MIKNARKLGKLFPKKQIKVTKLLYQYHKLISNSYFQLTIRFGKWNLQ